MKEPYFFLQRSKPAKPKKSKRGLAICCLLLAILFAVVMHWPRQHGQAVALHTKPRTARQVTVPQVITTTEDQIMPYGTTTVMSAALPAGTTKITTPGVNGIWTKTYQQTITNGVPGPKRLIGISTTRDAVGEVITEGSGPAN